VSNPACRKCGAEPPIDNVVLVRVNEKGVPGIWQCSPTCGHQFKDRGEAVLHALLEAARPEVKGGD